MLNDFIEVAQIACVLAFKDPEFLTVVSVLGALSAAANGFFKPYLAIMESSENSPLSAVLLTAITLDFELDLLVKAI